jgi:hypothetical protein
MERMIAMLTSALQKGKTCSLWQATATLVVGAAAMAC